MKDLMVLILLIFLACCSMSPASAQLVQPSHVYLATTGSDANECLYVNPCQTFQGALSKVADGGTITVLDAGSYQPFTINKSVKIVAASGNRPTVSGIVSGSTILVAAGQGNVSIDGLIVMGNSDIASGISATSVSNLQILNVDILGSYRFALSVIMTASLTDTIDLQRIKVIRDKAKTGVGTDTAGIKVGTVNANNVSIRDVTVSNYFFGIRLFNNIRSVGSVIISDSLIENAAGQGIVLWGDNTASEVTLQAVVERTIVARCDVAFAQGIHSELYLSRDVIANNNKISEGDTIFSDETNVLAGNKDNTRPVWKHNKPE
jgi:hypothetical protein